MCDATSLRLLALLVGKNFLVKIRHHVIFLFLEMCMPLVAATIFIIPRLLSPIRQAYSETHSPMDTLSAYNESKMNTRLKVAYAPTTDTTDFLVRQLEEKFISRFHSPDLISFTGFTSEMELADNQSDIQIALIFESFSSQQTLVNSTTDHNMTSSGHSATVHNTSASSNTVTPSATPTDRQPSTTTSTITQQNTLSSLPDHLDVVIRPRTGLGSSSSWHTDSLYPPHDFHCSNSSLEGYKSIGVNLLLQFTMEILISARSATPLTYTVYTQGVPCRQKREDPLEDSLRVFMPLTVSLSFLPNAISLAFDMAVEKNKNIQESLEMAGVSGCVYFLSWLTFALLQVTILAIFSSAIVMLPGKLSALPRSDPGPLLVLFLLYGLAVTSVAFCVAELRLQAKTSSKLVFLVLLVMSLPVLFTSDYSARETIVSSVFINHVLHRACNHVITYEIIGRGLNWAKIWRPPTILHAHSISDFLVMFAVAIIIFIVTFLLLRYTVPPLRLLYFAFQDWKQAVSDKKRRTNSDPPTKGEHQKDIPSKGKQKPDTSCKGGHWEDNPDLSTYMRFEHVTKRIRSGCSLHDVSLTLYEAHTTVLLGQPGAGMSELIPILTGHSRVDSGKVTIKGTPVQRNHRQQPNWLSICGHGSSVFHTLTVWENVYLFSWLKGGSQLSARLEAETLVRRCGLWYHMDVKARNLIGLAAKLLDLAVALTGDPQMLIVEEPTKNLEDRQLRRLLNFLKEALSSRTALVTTTSSQVAFHLADKMALIIDGHIFISGSRPYVEQHLGSGYQLAVKILPGCDMDSLVKYMQLFVPSLIVLRKSRRDLICLLSSLDRPKFEFLFSNLRIRSQSLKMVDFSLNEISVEELLSRLKDCQAASAHFSHLEKCRFNNEVWSLRSLSDTGIGPILVYSALVRTASGHFNVIRSQSADSTTVNNRIDAIFGPGMGVMTEIPAIRSFWQLFRRRASRELLNPAKENGLSVSQKPSRLRSYRDLTSSPFITMTRTADIFQAESKQPLTSTGTELDREKGSVGLVKSFKSTAFMKENKND